MCHACVIQSVKDRMLSRRQFLGKAAAGSAAVAGATAVSTALVPAAHAMSHGEVMDVTHELHEDFPTYFGEQQFFRESKANFSDNGFNLLELRLSEHVGTHLDAPLHFSADGQSVAEIPLNNLICPLCIIDIREKAAADADAQVTPEDVKAWIAANGDIPDNACVAMLSGWGEHANTDKFRNADTEGVMHFPGFHVDATSMLLEETKASGIAVDTLSLDHGPSADFATHYAWLPQNRWGLECAANLEKLPVNGATLVVGAPKIRGGTGGPSRVLAMV